MAAAIVGEADFGGRFGGLRGADEYAQALAWSDDGQPITQLKDDPRLAAKMARMDSEITFTKSAISLAQQDLKSYEGLIRISMVRTEDVKKAEEELAKVQQTRDEKKAALEKVKTENGKVEPAEKAVADAETAVTVAGTVRSRSSATASRFSRLRETERSACIAPPATTTS